MRRDGRTDRQTWCNYKALFENFKRAKNLDHPLRWAAIKMLHVCKLAMSLQILTLPLAYDPVRHVCYGSVCGGWDPTVGCFNHFSQRIANSPLTMRCHSSRIHFAGFLSGLSLNEKLQACITLWTSFNTQRLLYLPPIFNIKKSTFCPHSVLVCFVWVYNGYFPIQH